MRAPKKPKVVTPIEDGVNRRFFVAIDTLVALGRLASLDSFCKESGLNSPRCGGDDLGDLSALLPLPNGTKMKRTKRAGKDFFSGYMDVIGEKNV